MLAVASLSFRAGSTSDEFRSFVVKRAWFVANGFTFCAELIRSLSFVVIRGVVWPTRCGVGHTYLSRTANGLLA